MINLEPPIAWLQLKHQKLQTFAAIASITFITLSLFMQLGFHWAFIGTLLELPKRLDGDLFLMDSSTSSILHPVEFSQQRLYQIPAFEEVESIIPLYFQSTETPDPKKENEFLRKILAIGFPLSKNPFDIKDLDNKLPILEEQGVFLINNRSKAKFDSILNEVETKNQHKILIRGGKDLKRIRIKGTFPMNISEVFESHLLCSDATFIETFETQRQSVSLAIIRLKPESDAKAVQKKLLAELPKDVTIREKQEMIDKEEYLFDYQSPMGIVFRAGLVVSVIVGIVVLYQVLFQLTSKYIREYATLKALGFSHFMLISIVLSQAIILAVIGYILGYYMAVYLYDEMTIKTGLKHSMTDYIMLLVFAQVCFICLISALFTVRKVSEADPADLFG